MALLATAAGCTGPLDPLPGSAAAPGDAVSTGVWSDGSVLEVRMRAFDEDGRVAFCGLWLTRGATAPTQLYHRDVLSTAVLYLGGVRITQGLAFLPRASAARDGAGSAMACRVSETPWRAGFADASPAVRFPHQQYDYDDEDGGDPLEFRQRSLPGGRL